MLRMVGPPPGRFPGAAFLLGVTDHASGTWSETGSGISQIPGGDVKDGRAATWKKFPGAAFLLGNPKKREENYEKKLLDCGYFLLQYFLAASTISYGFDEKQVQSLKKQIQCNKCDLSGAKLNNLDLTYADLSGANLSGADLTGTVMQSANLTGQIVRGQLHGSKL